MSEDLYFAPSAKTIGFNASGTADHTGDSHPVIRELVQNALDADTGSGVEVDFEISTINTSDIPHVKAYREYLDLAIETQKKLMATHSSGEIKTSKDIEKGKEMLECSLRKQVDVLYCRDNGIGIRPETMRSLLGEGMSYGKSDESAGSFGLGHFQAFGASDLRYVLYAGRYKEGKGLEDVASGEVILASFQRNKRGYAPAGYLLLDEIQDDLFGLDQYLNDPPEILANQFNRLPDKSSGSIVAILGFNNFKEEHPQDAVSQIEEVCVKNFFIAIKSGSLRIRLHDSRDKTRNWELNKSNISSIIDNLEQRTSYLRGSKLSHAFAKSAFLTYDKPEKTFTVKGAKIFLRKAEDGKQQIHIARSGMWITRSTSHLFPGPFSGYNPIHCVITAEGKPSNHLFRKAEGVLHIGLDKRRFIDKSEKKEFESIMREIRNKIIDWAGEQVIDSSFIPNIARYNEWRGASQSKPMKPRGGSGKGRKPPNPNPNPDPVDPSESNAPKQGKTIQAKVAYLPITEKQSNSAVGINITYTLVDKSFLGSNIGVQVFLRSGADISCEKPPSTTWVPIRSSKTKFEASIENAKSTGDLKLLFDVPFPAESEFGINFVNRKEEKVK